MSFSLATSSAVNITRLMGLIVVKFFDRKTSISRLSTSKTYPSGNLAGLFRTAWLTFSRFKIHGGEFGVNKLKRMSKREKEK